MTRPLVVTGPTGWIGRATLARLAVDGALERVRLFGSSARTIEVAGTMLPVRPLREIEGRDVAGADVIHLAYLTKEKAEALGEAAFVAGNRAIDAALLAACDEAPPHAIFVASSGAAMLAGAGTDPHPYGHAKLAQERAFLDYGRASGVPVVPGRIFNLAGPHINKVESYAIASFLTQGRRDRRIPITAAQPVYRSYLHVDDLVRLVVALLDMGMGYPAPIDFCGSEIVEMGEIACAAAKVLGLDEATITRPALACGTSSAYLGDPADIRTIAQHLDLPLRSFIRQVEDTAAFLRDTRNIEIPRDRGSFCGSPNISRAC